jgi:hypothetical protein
MKFGLPIIDLPEFAARDIGITHQTEIIHHCIGIKQKGSIFVT